MIIDVSAHQGKIDWTKVKGNIEAAILRCGIGDNIASQDDKYFAYNMKQCEDLEIPFGVYIYSYANSVAHAKSEADHVLRLIKGHKLALPVYLDLEERRYKSFSLTCWNTFKPIIEAAGYRVGIYAGMEWFNSVLASAKCDHIWIPRYGSNRGTVASSLKPNVKVSYELWQYSSRGSCPGISSSGLDVNEIMDAPSLWDKTKTSTTTKAETKTRNTEKAKTSKYTVGKTYNITAHALNVRTGPDIKKPTVGRNKLTVNAKRHSTASGALLKGTKVTCKEVKENGSDIWIRIPSGWIAAYYKGSTYIK